MAVPVLESGYTTTSGTGTSVTITAPSSISADDLLIIAVNHDIENEGYTWPSGFTELFTDGFRFEHAIAWKIAVSADESASDYTVSWSSNDTYTALMFRVSGVDTTTPINVSGKGLPSFGAYQAPSITTTVDDCLVVTGWASDDAKTQTQPSGTTMGPNLTVDESMATAYYTQSSAGATGTKDWSGGTEAYAWQIGIAPGGGGGGGTTPYIQYIHYLYAGGGQGL